MPVYDKWPDIIEREPRFEPFIGRVTRIEEMQGESAGCSKFVLVEDEEGQMINFVVSPNTYFVDGAKIDIDSIVIVYYNINAPAILIYPPQLEAVAIALEAPGVNIKMDVFDENFVSMDGTLQLNISEDTEIVGENGQNFYGQIINRPLVVKYGASTRSIPAQTTPEKITVMCRY